MQLNFYSYQFTSLMKKSLLLLLVLLLTQSVQAQNCSPYFAFPKGQKFELTNYDKKDKVSAVTKYEVLDVKAISDGTAFVVETATYDLKGSLLAKGEANAKCVGGIFYTDVRNISSDMMPRSANVTVDITGDQLMYPAQLAPGDKLKDATFTAKTAMGGMNLMTLTANIVDRKVAGMETVTTPAGSFECVKITYTINMRLMGNRTISAVEYLAQGVGVVKSEQLDDKGRKLSSTLLTKLEK